MTGQWWRHAACKDMDVNIFFPESKAQNRYDEARKICATCPVIDECLDAAIIEGSWDGMYGGMTRDQRRGLAVVRGLITRPYANCDDMKGTTAGYYREKELGIPHCKQCLKAYNHASAVRQSAARRKARDVQAAGSGHDHH